MAFDIGNVVSPQVAAALIRRGESTGGGGGISRRDPIRRTEHVDTTDQDQAAFDRIALQEQAQQEQLAMLKRREAFDRERFERGLEEREKDRQAGIEAGKSKAEQNRKIGQGKIREKVAGWVKDIGKIWQAGNKPGEDGKPNPEAQRQAQQQIAALWKVIQNSGLDPKELAEIADSIRSQNPSTPASRAPGGGIQRGAPPKPKAPPMMNEEQGAEGRAGEWFGVTKIFREIKPGSGASEQEREAVRAEAERRMQTLLQRVPPEHRDHFIFQYNKLLKFHGFPPVPGPGSEPEAPQGGIQRDSPSGAAPSASKVEAGVSRELGTPNRTP